MKPFNQDEYDKLLASIPGAMPRWRRRVHEKDAAIQQAEEHERWEANRSREIRPTPEPPMVDPWPGSMMMSWAFRTGAKSEWGEEDQVAFASDVLKALSWICNIVDDGLYSNLQAYDKTVVPLLERHAFEQHTELKRIGDVLERIDDNIARLTLKLAGS